MNLTSKQKLIINNFKKGENIFITGAAGSGKSFILTKLVEICKSDNLKLSVTATTGTAAILLGNNSKTINSWAGIGICNLQDEQVIHKVITNRKKRLNWLNTRVLIIDEVSMLSQRIFEILNKIGQIIRNSNRPFGGIQLIFSGDFYQLPPVKDNFHLSDRFCFESNIWDESFSKDNQIHLKTIFRQTDDVYKKVLNQIRKGTISKESYNILLGCVNKQSHSDILPVKLYPRRSTVDKINQEYNDNIDGIAFNYDTGVYESNKQGFKLNISDEKLSKQIKAAFSKNPDTINLKVGSQVMCTVNIDLHSTLQICNGSCGIITHFTDKVVPVVKFHNGRILEMDYYQQNIEYNDKNYTIEFIPLMLAWAVTIHKSQGMSLDVAEIDVGSSIFESGQTYVALSRVKTICGLFLKSFDVTRITVRSVVKNFYEKLKKS